MRMFVTISSTVAIAERSIHTSNFPTRSCPSVTHGLPATCSLTVVVSGLTGLLRVLIQVEPCRPAAPCRADAGKVPIPTLTASPYLPSISFRVKTCVLRLVLRLLVLRLVVLRLVRATSKTVCSAHDKYTQLQYSLELSI